MTEWYLCKFKSSVSHLSWLPFLERQFPPRRTSVRQYACKRARNLISLSGRDGAVLMPRFLYQGYLFVYYDQCYGCRCQSSVALLAFAICLSLRCSEVQWVLLTVLLGWKSTLQLCLCKTAYLETASKSVCPMRNLAIALGWLTVDVRISSLVPGPSLLNHY